MVMRAHTEKRSSSSQRNNLSFTVSKTKQLIIDFRRGERTHKPLNIGGTLVERMNSLTLHHKPAGEERRTGTAVWNHTVALLFQTAHYSELNVQVVPPVHTCTETEHQRHKPRTSGVKPGPINKMVITKPRLNRLSEGGIRSTLYKGLVGDPLDLSLLQIGDAYKDLDIKEKPLVATMGISDEKTLVETAFGMAQKGSVLSYQLPILPTKSVKMHQDAPPYPPLPPEECRLHPTQYWESSQPDDGGRESTEDCVITGTRLWKRWNDKPCQKSYYWICEKGFPDVTEAD
ncbi:hypothetical protein NFI96_008252 [Prochilodus magdalenae]|nr:hypothetical protein NFI96_008252 [Prochilodus magdalenae]